MSWSGAPCRGQNFKPDASQFMRTFAAAPVFLPLLHSGRLMPRGLNGRLLLFSVLFCHVPTDDTAADCTDHRMVSRIVPGDAAYYRSLQATGRVRGAGHRQGDCDCPEGGPNKTSFHCKYHRVGVDRK
jgi:hypothetical protein